MAKTHDEYIYQSCRVPPNEQGDATYLVSHSIHAVGKDLSALLLAQSSALTCQIILNTKGGTNTAASTG